MPLLVSFAEIRKRAMTVSRFVLTDSGVCGKMNALESMTLAAKNKFGAAVLDVVLSFGSAGVCHGPWGTAFRTAALLLFGSRQMLCPHSCGLLLRSSAGNLLHVQADCRTWNCSYCLTHHMKPKWLKHFLAIVEGSPNGLWRVEIPESQWDSFRKSAKRHGTLNYFRLRHGRRLVVYLDSNMDGAVRMDRLAAERHVIADVEKLKAGKHPVSSSRGWKFVETKGPSEHTLAAFGVTKRAFQRVMAAADVAVATIRSHSRISGRNVLQAATERLTAADRAKLVTECRRFSAASPKFSLEKNQPSAAIRTSGGERTAWDALQDLERHKPVAA